MALLSLSNELLSNCLLFLSDHKSDIRNLRLVSKRVDAIASRFLITKAHVSFDHSSITALEALSSHFVWSTSVKFVQVDVSYYDELLANSCRRFVEHAAHELSYALDFRSRTTGRWYDREGNIKDEHKEDYKIFMKAHEISEHWNRAAADMTNESFNKSDATDTQKLLFTAHENYATFYDEQQELLTSGQGVSRVAQALKRMTALNEIVIKDARWSKVGGDNHFITRYNQFAPWVGGFRIEGLIERSLKKSYWKGSFMTAMDTQPPVQILADLFASLAELSISPTSFTINITPPSTLR